MSTRKISPSRCWTLNPFEWTLLYRMVLQAVRLAGVVSFFLAIAIAGAASAQTKVATATSLSVSAGGSGTISVSAGTVVTLNARVTAGGANVGRGQVNFCDATAAYCTDVHILFTAQLTSSGTATYNFRPGIGSRSYKAVFAGTNAYAGSVSSASPLTVTGTAGVFATSSSIAETGAWGNYTLTGTVTEAGGTAAPTGTVSFLDANHGNSVLATGSLGAAVGGVSWPNPKSLSNTLDTYFVLATDLNGDGIPDLVLGSNVVSIYRGIGDGTYSKATGPSFQGPTSYPIVTADFNGDGIPDLAVPMYGTNKIGILLGKGDGTFLGPVMTSVPGSIVDITQIVAGDFTGDGNPDLAVIDRDNSAVDILLGNGDGTFTQEAMTPPISGIPSQLATGDFNGDGKTDLAVSEGSGAVAILLGNGDGTFAASGNVNSGSTGVPIAVADFNGDGKLDIVVATGNGTSESAVVLTGNGDGTFHSPSSGQNATSTSATWIQVADFNQDGAPDVVLSDTGGSATVFLNNGGGSLSQSFLVVSGLSVPLYFEVGVADLNGDGYPDIVAGGYYESTQGLYLTEPSETASASASVQINGVGQHLAEVSFPAEGNYESSVSSPIPLWGLLPATSTMLGVTSGGLTVTGVTPGTAVVLTAQVSAGSTPVGAGLVNFCDASAPHCTDIHILGSAALNSSGMATFKFVPGPGAHSYQAQFVEGGFGLASASNIASLNVGPVPGPVYSDTVAIDSGGSPGNYSLIATITGYGGPAVPTGTVSFIDTSFGNNILATVSLGTGTPGVGFLESLTSPFGSYPIMEATADFNGDGVPDLAVLSSNSTYQGPYTVAVFVGNGDGTFRAGPTIQPSGIQDLPYMISGDFNGDGKPDLAILSSDSFSTIDVTILLSNGDGSFSAKATAVVFPQVQVGGDVGPGAMAAADLNGDGKLDLAVVGDYASTGGAIILLGNGDGTFNAGPILAPTEDFGQIAIGDLNGDGIPDLVATHYFENATPPTIFLGNGDGTFTAKPGAFTLTYFPTSIVVGDFNSDGILDVAFSDGNGVEIALGKGDGTFSETPASPISVPSRLYSLQAGDFNHDGKLDLAGLDNYNDRISLLEGAGDGTFAVTATTPVVSTSFNGPFQISAGDFNGDGVPDLAMLTKNVNTASILLTKPASVLTATVSGIAPLGAGTHNVEASYSGDSNYGALTSNTVALTAGLAPLVFTPGAGTYTSAQTVTITEALPGSTIYYTTDGTRPTTSSMQYTGPITVSTTERIEAIAVETGYSTSAITGVAYTISLSPGFALSASPVSVPVPQGGSGTSAISVTDIGGFTGTVTLSATGLPSGVSASFTAGSGSAPGVQVMTLTANAAAATTLSAVTVTITGTSGSLSAITTIELSITPPANFAAGTGGTTSMTVTPGTTTGNTGTISVAGKNGFSGIVNLTCSVTTGLTGVSGMPTCSLNPTSVTIVGGGTQTSTLTVNTTAASSAENERRNLFWPQASGATFAFALFILRTRKRKDWLMLIGLLLLLISIGPIACGGGSSGGSGSGSGGNSGGTTPGAYTIIVTGTSGSVSATVGAVVLTVQ